MKIGITVLGIVAVLVATAVVSYITNYNYGNTAEKTIVAEYANMENILAQYSLKVREAAQVPGMKTEDLGKVMREAMTGRYGKDGSTAVFQWIKENYPGQVSDALYVQIQQIIEAGRNKFENAQTKFIDTKRVYETNLGYFWKGFWLRTAGYPKIDLATFVVISSEHAQEAFKTGVDKGVNLREK
ncbi:MAG: hypothetical protein HYT29_01235 [Parcubacteria group bacterium]|nr:hypothetical protein [Parcubacteria group bacterium]